MGHGNGRSGPKTQLRVYYYLLSKLNSRDSSGQLDCSQLNHHVSKVVDGTVKSDICGEGLVGCFRPVNNDFTRREPGANEALEETSLEHHGSIVGTLPEGRFTQKTGKFRFLIATMALVAVALSLESRTILNMSIVEMTKGFNNQPVANSEVSSIQVIDNNTIAPVVFDGVEQEDLSTLIVIDQSTESSLRFNWTRSQQNLLLASFYIGYAPSMLLTGGLADKYGSYLLLFVCIFSSALINLVTPTMAAYSYTLLVTSRIILGLLQGGLVPAVYDLFKRWLTATETSIVAPLAKLSFAAGQCIGSILPWLAKKLDREWPFLFYLTSVVCLIWSSAWLFLATNSPENNRFVGRLELERVNRKKRPQSISIVLVDSNGQQQEKKVVDLANVNNGTKQDNKASGAKEPPIPWLAIATHPSVIVLALTKYTYNLTMEFVPLMMPSFLRQVHGSPIETISKIMTACTLMQLVLTLPIVWLAKIVVQKEKFGISKTKWRKIFQGFANFSSALMFFLFPLVSTNLTLVVVLTMFVCFFWIFGAGGESLVPYDLSTRYPATIMGLAHSFSITAGLTLPGYCSLILGEDIQNVDLSRWSRLFNLVGLLALLGGLLFVFVLKAKPFLPGERKR